MSILRIVAFVLMLSASTAFASGHGGSRHSSSGSHHSSGGHHSGGSHHSSGSHHK